MRSISSLLPLLLTVAVLVAAIGLPSRAAAQTAEPLRLTLTAERSECTAGTLNPVSWTITGGTPPYTLAVDGATVDPTAEGVNVTCGALPEGASEAPGTIPATVTDATGAPATASAAYTIVPPLPAPTGLSLDAVLQHKVTFHWDAVDGAGSQSPLVRKEYRAAVVSGSDKYLFRYRAAAADATAPYELIEPLWSRLAEVQPDPLDASYKPITTGDYLGMVAAIRHPIEQETPEALNWSAPVPFGVARAPQNIVVQTTHDTVDVFWDAQPYAQRVSVRLGREGGVSLWRSRWDITTTAGRHHARFRHLIPETEYEIEIEVGDDVVRAPISSTTTARTSAAPADWEPLPKGPQNLRATATHDSITLHWDLPFPEAPPYWFVGVTIIIEGREWEVQRESTGTPPPEGLTLRGDFQPIRPNATYQVFVSHDGFDASFAEISVTTPAAPAPPPRLALTAARAECTAGTLNPITWEIRGGVEPYRLTVDGASVDADAESATVTCGNLPAGASEAPGAITATVTDATGAPATASAAYTIVEPLPAPTGLEHVSSPGSVTTWWSDVPGVAELTREDPEGTPYTIDAYLVRYRAVGASEWIHALRGPTGDEVWEIFDAGIREFSVAALRHPLERLTPAALQWSAAHPYAPVVVPQNVVATATHDTVTVSWDKQPHGEFGVVRLSGAGGGVSERFPMATSAGRHSITFGDLPPSTTYRVLVNYYPPERLDTYTWTEVTTLAPPPDFEPLPSGPQNLRATATHNSITVSWDPSRPATPLRYAVQVFHAESGIRVEVWHLPEGVTSATVIGTFWRIQPDTLYEVVVFELGIPGATAELSIRTSASPGQDGLLTCIEITPGWRICWTPDVTSG